MQFCRMTWINEQPGSTEPGPSLPRHSALTPFKRWVKKLGVGLALLTATLVAQAQEFTGVVFPLRDLTLSVSNAGVVSGVRVEIGDRVAQGQPLLQLEAEQQNLEVNRRKVIMEDNSELRSVQQRQQILDQLYADGRRLFESSGSISREELMKLRIESLAVAGRADQIRAEKRREQLEYEMAQQDYRLRTLVAPIDGVVTDLRVDVGEWASPGEPVLRLVDASVVELRVNVTQAAARRLALGDTLAVLIEDPAIVAPIDASVVFVSPVADAASGLVDVRVRFDNADGRVRPGAKGRIRMGVEG